VEHPLRVPELLELVNERLRALGTVAVRAQVSQVRRSARGHRYLTLADDEEEGALLHAVLFAGTGARVDAALHAAGLPALAEGALVVVRGSLDVYPPTGELRLVVTDVDVEAMRDARAARRARNLRLLVAAGLAEANRQRKLPAVPLRVAIVTSSAGVVHLDIQRVLDASGYRFRTSVHHSPVTGREAAPALRRALAEALGTRPDVIIVARGGGSSEDLDAFDDLELARDVARAPVPVIAAIGHAVDEPLVALVAYRAIDVPQSAGAYLVEQVRAFLTGLAVSVETVRTRTEARLGVLRLAVHDIGATLVASALGTLAEQREALARARSLRALALGQLRYHRARLYDPAELERAAVRRLLRARERLVAAQAHRVAAGRRLERDRAVLATDERRLLAAVGRRVRRERADLAPLGDALARQGTDVLGRHTRCLEVLRWQLLTRTGARLRSEERTVTHCGTGLASFASALEAGFAMLATPERRWLRRALEVQGHDEVLALFVDGALTLAPRS